MKKYIILLSTILVMTTNLLGCDNKSLFKSAKDLEINAQESLDKKNYTDSIEWSTKLIEKDSKNANGYFLLAQAKAQLGEKNSSIAALEKAIDLGINDPKKINDNKNLEPIKNTNGYIDLMKEKFKDFTTENSNNDNNNSVEIIEKNGRQEIKAGDIQINIPSTK